jgi:hypothetical protein
MDKMMMPESGRGVTHRESVHGDEKGASTTKTPSGAAEALDNSDEPDVGGEKHAARN